MSPTLYIRNESPAVRSVLMTAKALNLKLKYILLNLAEKEHLTPEFLKINPQHTIPTLVDDDGAVIWDSHAINIYLVTKYASDDFLYPNDLYKRATIDQRLHFDSGVTFELCKAICMPLILNATKTVPVDKAEAVVEAYAVLEKFLENHDWVAANNVTLADLILIPSVTSLDVLVAIDGGIFPNIIAWIKRAQTLPYYEANQEGLNNFRKFVLDL